MDKVFMLTRARLVWKKKEDFITPLKKKQEENFWD